MTHIASHTMPSEHVSSLQRKLNRRKRFKQNFPLLLMFIPVVAYYTTFKYVPMLGLVLAFKDYNLFDGILHSPWVGLEHFRTLFNDPATLRIIKNTLLLSLLNIVLGFPVPIILAILLNEVRSRYFKKAVQTIVYLPHFFSWVIIGGLVLTVFSLENGVVNTLLKQLTGETYSFLYEPGSWIAIFVGSGIWKDMGFSAVIYLAALTTIDPSLYEAASMDGANKARQIWHITLPGIRSTIILLLVLSMGRVLEVGFDQVYMLQNPVVTSVSEVISTYIYRVGLQGAQFSLTTAMGFFESVVAFILVVTSNWIARQFNEGLW